MITQEVMVSSVIVGRKAQSITNFLWALGSPKPVRGEISPKFDALCALGPPSSPSPHPSPPFGGEGAAGRVRGRGSLAGGGLRPAQTEPTKNSVEFPVNPGNY